MTITKFEKGKRLCMLDELRGIAIIAMVIYHTIYSMAFIFHLDFSYSIFLQAYKFQPLIPILFITLCGISCSFSKSNLKRGALIFAIAIVITIATYIFMPSTAIPENIGATISLALFIIFYNIPNGYIGYQPFLSLELPPQLYSCYPLFVIGLPTPDFSSGDYFPLIPYIFLLYSGCFLGKLILKNGAPDFMYKKLCPPLDFLGKHSLLIYVAHQPLIIGILFLVTSFLGV